MPVDPIRYIFNKRKVFEPPPHDKNNRMVYVVAVEEDGYARDVTRRYAKAYSAQTVKVQLGGKGRQEWWGKVIGSVTRPFRLVSQTSVRFSLTLLSYPFYYRIATIWKIWSLRTINS